MGQNRRNAPLRSENSPLRKGNGPLRPWCWLACSMDCFRAPPPWRKTPPLKAPLERPMIRGNSLAHWGDRNLSCCPSVWLLLVLILEKGTLQSFLRTLSQCLNVLVRRDQSSFQGNLRYLLLLSSEKCKVLVFLQV